MAEKIEVKTKDQIIAELKAGLAELRAVIAEMETKYREAWGKMLPHLSNEMRLRAKTVWEAALHAHTHAQPGEPHPTAVIARALMDAEAIGPRPDRPNAVIDPVEATANRLYSFAKLQGRDPVDIFNGLRDVILSDVVDEDDEGPAPKGA